MSACMSHHQFKARRNFRLRPTLLMSVHHKNLTSLVGYCNEGTHIGLVYEYMANGNLEAHLSGRNSNVLSWEERLRTAVDAAQGLEYLHHGCKPPIIHRDVKSTIILLSDIFQAKLSDFGLSRIIPIEGDTHVTTVVAGTPGYLDPEYYTTNRLTEKSDVFSYGVVLLEMITGRPAIGNININEQMGQSSNHVIQWVNSVLGDGDVKSIVDTRLREDFDVNYAWKAVELAMACVSVTSTTRPSMNHMVNELKECLATEIARHETTTSSNNSVGMMVSLNLKTELGPQAR